MLCWGEKLLDFFLVDDDFTETPATLILKVYKKLNGPDTYLQKKWMKLLVSLDASQLEFDITES